jgi:hypothetical protein
MALNANLNEQLVEPCPGVTVVEFDDEVVVIGPRGKTFYGLNQTAYFVWDKALSGLPASATAIALADEYDCSPSDYQRILRDVIHIYEDLLRHQLLRRTRRVRQRDEGSSSLLPCAAEAVLDVYVRDPLGAARLGPIDRLKTARVLP